MPKVGENSNNSGSSDDKTINKDLQEATDTQFLKKDMFDEETSADKQELSNIKYNDVSEGFKDFLAKRLAELLDRSIEMTEKTICSKHSRKRRRMEHEESDCGIRLLRTSGSFIKNVDINTSHNCTSKFTIKTVENMTSKDNLLRCKEAAVDPQWILSRFETKFWSEKQKGTVYEYKKLADGTLVEK